MTTYTYTGTDWRDHVELSTLRENLPAYTFFIINAGKGDDKLVQNIANYDTKKDVPVVLNGQQGDDLLYSYGHSDLTMNGGAGDDDFTIFSTRGNNTELSIIGGSGIDVIDIGWPEPYNEFMLPSSKEAKFTRVENGTLLTIEARKAGGTTNVFIQDSVEFIFFYDEAGKKSVYATQDIASGIIKKGSVDEVTSEIDWWQSSEDSSEIPKPSKIPTSGTSLLNKIIGTSKKDKLTGTNGGDEIHGREGSDRINGRGGDDLIDPGLWNKGRFDNVKGGKGSDTFIIKDGYWAFIKDFNIIEDKLDITGLSNGLEWDTKGRKTYIYGSENLEVARLKGKFDLSAANII